MTTTSQTGIDERNAAFWDELCGSVLARDEGIDDRSPDGLRRYDDAYMGLYPYLPAQLPAPSGYGERLLEIGLGYGTVGQWLHEAGFEYHGLDIAAGPVMMMRERLRIRGVPDCDDRVVQGSALAIPHADASFDRVVSIGCLHHTGNLPHAIREVDRVLRPGGRAMVMLYNRHSLRQAYLRWTSLLRRVGPEQQEVEARAAYDANLAGEVAPETVFVSARQVRAELFAQFSEVRVERHNFDNLLLVPRRLLLGNIARVVGLDLYINATK